MARPTTDRATDGLRLRSGKETEEVNASPWVEEAEAEAEAVASHGTGRTASGFRFPFAPFIWGEKHLSHFMMLNHTTSASTETVGVFQTGGVWP